MSRSRKQPRKRPRHDVPVSVALERYKRSERARVRVELERAGDEVDIAPRRLTWAAYS